MITSMEETLLRLDYRTKVKSLKTMIDHESQTNNQSDDSPWTSWVGIILIVLGVYLTAAHGTELMVHAVLDGEASIEMDGYQHDCPEDELEEEGITLAMCQQATHNVDSLLLSRPDWFRGFQLVLMSFGTLFAFSSIFVGVALIESRGWAPRVALVILSGLLLVDILGFLAVVSSGPLLRQMYLWQILMWFFIHSLLLAATFAGIDDDKMQAITPSATQTD